MKFSVNTTNLGLKSWVISLFSLFFFVPVRTYSAPHCIFQKKMQNAFLLQQYKPTDYIYLFQHWRRKQVSSLELSADEKRWSRFRCASACAVAIVTNFFFYLFFPPECPCVLLKYRRNFIYFYSLCYQANKVICNLNTKFDSMWGQGESLLFISGFSICVINLSLI